MRAHRFRQQPIDQQTNSSEVMFRSTRQTIFGDGLQSATNIGTTSAENSNINTSEQGLSYVRTSAKLGNRAINIMIKPGSTLAEF